MAKKSIVQREMKRARLCQKYNEKRHAIKEERRKAMRDGDMEKVLDCQRQLQKIPKNANPTRGRERCRITGRPRGTYNKFGLSKNMLRKQIMEGEVPGTEKASW